MAVLIFSCFLLQSSVDWFGKSVATFTQWPPPGRTIGLISCIIFLGFANVKYSLHLQYKCILTRISKFRISFAVCVTFLAKYRVLNGDNHKKVLGLLFDIGLNRVNNGNGKKW
jgi:hypothetical protein